MSEIIDATLYRGDTAISNTLRYSIESYAARNINSTNTNLAKMLERMMYYGNAVKAYAASVTQG